MNRGDMMISKTGTKIYYCNVTGNVIKIIGDMVGYLKETTFDEDCEIYIELKERDKNVIGLIEFAYGEYSKLSINSTGAKVNLETKELEFSYGPLPVLPQEPNEIDEIKDKINTLESENKELKDSVVKTQSAIDFILMNNGGI